MYISSFLLFGSSTIFLYYSIKNCRRFLEMYDINIQYHPQKDDIFFGEDFIEHAMFQKELNQEIENKY